MPAPLKFEYPYHWGQKVYLKTDDEQLVWQLDGIKIDCNGTVFRLFRNGEYVEVFDNQFTTRPSLKRKLGIDKDETDTEE